VSVGSVEGVRPQGHENVATVLVDPFVLHDFELDFMSIDLRVWPIQTTPIYPDGPRLAFQVRRAMIEANQGRWDLAADWTPVWIGFGDSWRDGDEPLPWAAHTALWDKLGEYRDHVRYRVGLGGVPWLGIHREDAV
jgi:hypothetical protein